MLGVKIAPRMPYEKMNSFDQRVRRALSPRIEWYFDRHISVIDPMLVERFQCCGSRFDSDLASIFKKAPRALFLTCAVFCTACPSGEIGRHSGLKIRRLPEKGRTGSIPVSGTIFL